METYLEEPFCFLGRCRSYYKKRCREVCWEYLGLDVDKYRGESFKYVEINGNFLFVDINNERT